MAETPKQIAILYKKAFKGENRKVLEDLEKKCGFKSIGLKDSAILNAYDKGRRDVYIYIQNLVDADLKRFDDAESKISQEE